MTSDGFYTHIMNHNWEYISHGLMKCIQSELYRKTSEFSRLEAHMLIHHDAPARLYCLLFKAYPAKSTSIYGNSTPLYKALRDNCHKDVIYAIYAATPNKNDLNSVTKYAHKLNAIVVEFQNKKE